MKAAAVLVCLVCASSVGVGVRAADPPLLVGAAARRSGGIGDGIALTGSGEEDGPKDWDCKQWQKIAEKQVGKMPPCTDGRKCTLPEWTCDMTSGEPLIEVQCGASRGNEQGTVRCGNAHCRDDADCMCGVSSNTCMKKTCLNLQEEHCPNSRLSGRCDPAEDECTVEGFTCNLKAAKTHECAETGRTRKDARNADAPKSMNDSSAGYAAKGTMSLSWVTAAGLAALVASAANRL